jgi:uncharacterized protein involved in exopolysaccharide biosynthesis
MNSEELILMQYARIIWSNKNILIRNVIITAIMVSILSLIMPKTFKSTAVLMLSETNSDNTLISQIGEIAIGNFLDDGQNSESNTIFAILKSRTMAESIINKMNLIEIYDSENLEEAVKVVQNNLIFRDLEEGTISVSAFSQTPWMSDELDCKHARELSVNIVKYLISELDRVNKLFQTDEARYQRLFLEKRHNETIVQLKAAENDLRIFQNKHNTLDLTEQTKAAINIGAEIKSQILIEEVKLGVLNKTYKLDHPEIEKLKLQISELEYQLATLDKNAVNSLQNDNNIFPKFSEIPDLSIKLIRLQREVEIQSALYLFLSEKYEASKIQEARDTPTIQILDDANLPIKRYQPKRALMVIGYSLIAFVLSFIYIIFVKFNKNSPMVN